MSVYVDPLMGHGWVLRGHSVKNCHLFTDAEDLAELHLLASRIGMKRAWFQDHGSLPHYDLTPSRRALAVDVGAIEVDRREAVRLWRERRTKIAALPCRPLSQGATKA